MVLKHRDVGNELISDNKMLGHSYDSASQRLLGISGGGEKQFEVQDRTVTGGGWGQPKSNTILGTTLFERSLFFCLITPQTDFPRLP